MLQAIAIQGHQHKSKRLSSFYVIIRFFFALSFSRSLFLSQALEAGSAQKNRLPTRPTILLTPAPFLQQPLPLLLTQARLLFFLVLPTFVEVLHHHAHEHVQHEEAHNQQEGDEIKQHPGIVVDYRLSVTRKRTKRVAFQIFNTKKQLDFFCLFISTTLQKQTCWSTPTASRPSYIIFTQPSLQDSTNSDMRA